jgi:hypothetical protein
VVLNVDETGWRVQGKTFWLWCLASRDAVYYLIDPRRGSCVLKKLFRACFNGGFGDRLLGCLQLGHLPCQTEMPAALAA